MDLEQKAFERLRLGEQMSKQYYNKPVVYAERKTE